MAAIAIASIIVRAPSSGAAQIFRKATDQNFWNHHHRVGPFLEPRLPVSLPHGGSSFSSPDPLRGGANRHLNFSSYRDNPRVIGPTARWAPQAE
jgi:hypothetical protein